MKNKYIIITLFILITVSVKSDWIQVSNGITQLNINDLTVSGNYILAGTNVTVTGGGVFRSSNNGNSWEQVYFTTTLSLASFDSFVYRGYQNGFSYSSNYGTNWITPGGASRWITALLADGNYVYSGCFTPTITTNRGVWISSNNGSNWQQTSLNNVNIYTIDKRNNFLIAGGEGVYQSTNNGIDWNTTLFISCGASASSEDRFYVGSSGGSGVYSSTNNGINWSQTTLNNVTINAIATYQNNVFAGGGFWASTNSGSTWIERIEGMGNLYVNSLVIFNDYIFAGTDGYGVWRRPISELVGLNTISNNVPDKYNLRQNFPNPFNPNTKIQFSIPKKSYIQIIVFDILGREIERLINKELQSSEYEIDYDGSNNSSGVYFYQLVSNGKNIDTKKFIISK